MNLRSKATLAAFAVAILALPCVLLSASGDEPAAATPSQEQLLARIEKLEARIAQLDNQVKTSDALIRQLTLSPGPVGPVQPYSAHPKARAWQPGLVPQAVPPFTQPRTINGIPYYTFLLSMDKTKPHVSERK